MKRVLIGATLALLLSGCSFGAANYQSDAYKSSPVTRVEPVTQAGNGSYFDVWRVWIDDQQRWVTCIDGYQGALSCDWTHPATPSPEPSL